MTTRTERLEKANELIKLISSCGQEFFKYGNNISEFVFIKNRLYYKDKDTHIFLPCWRNSQSYKYCSAKWQRNFSDGGTLKSLVQNMAGYIMINKKLFNHFGPYPNWYCNSDNYWGYSTKDMNKIRIFYKENFQ